MADTIRTIELASVRLSVTFWHGTDHLHRVPVCNVRQGSGVNLSIPGRIA